jgi:hypothetical protein
MATAAATAYDLRGDLIEACSCMGPCPCWVGDDPDAPRGQLVEHDSRE